MWCAWRSMHYAMQRGNNHYAHVSCTKLGNITIRKGIGHSKEGIKLSCQIRTEEAHCYKYEQFEW